MTDVSFFCNQEGLFNLDGLDGALALAGAAGEADILFHRGLVLNFNRLNGADTSAGTAANARFLVNFCSHDSPHCSKMADSIRTT